MKKLHFVHKMKRNAQKTAKRKLVELHRNLQFCNGCFDTIKDHKSKTNLYLQFSLG